MPVVPAPHAAARRVVATFAICGDAWRDRLQRRVGGNRVTMRVTVWAGTLAFVEASTARRTTYGLAEIRPLPGDAALTLVRVRIFVPRGPLARLDAMVRADFVRAFLRPDARLLDGARYDPLRLIAADRLMIDYLRWLAPVSHGRLESKETS